MPDPDEMPKPTREAEVVNRWRSRQQPPPSVGALCAAVGDDGHQLYKWLSGHRQSVSLGLKARLARHMDEPLLPLCTIQQKRVVREIRRTG